jgi:hypothetical protein
MASIEAGFTITNRHTDELDQLVFEINANDTFLQKMFQALARLSLNTSAHITTLLGNVEEGSNTQEIVEHLEFVNDHLDSWLEKYKIDDNKGIDELNLKRNLDSSLIVVVFYTNSLCSYPEII